MLRMVWVVLLAPVVILALRLSIFDPNARDIDCFEAQTAFEVQDYSGALPLEPVLLIGNQRVKHWTETPEMLGGQAVLKRTLGGLTPKLLDECFTRLVGYYQPSRLILLLDTEGIETRRVDDLLDDLSGIMAQRSLYGLRFEMTIIGPITSPRVSSTLAGQLNELRNVLKDWSKETLGTQYIGVDDLFSDDAQAVNTDYFWPDGNTLTDVGYKKLTAWLISLSNERQK